MGNTFATRYFANCIKKNGHNVVLELCESFYAAALCLKLYQENIMNAKVSASRETNQTY